MWRTISIAMMILFVAMAAVLIGGMIDSKIAQRLGGEDFIPFTISLFTLLYVLLTALMLLQMNRVHESEFRPYISVDLIIEQHKVWLRVTNIGKSAGKNVAISFDPDIEMKTGKSLNTSIFRNKIAYFPPGKELVSFIAQSPEFLNNSQSEYSVRCQYRDVRGKREYNEDHSITVDYAKSVAFFREYDLGDIYNQLKALSATVESVSDALTKLASGRK